ncbi:MAG TPA: Flp pilus assembly protein CpaB [Planctomycetaceae bacterium]|jgi:pilus assembly protein CpaB|nr:Flp pilus assembly protein CpaB [Planctomycetaceae bacterium]
MRRLTPAGVSTLMVLVVGLLVTAYFAKLMRAEDALSQAAAQAQVIDIRNVPVTICALEPGTVITAAHLGTNRVRAETLPSDTLLQDRALVGRAVKERIAAGSAVRANQLYAPGEVPQPNVSRGMRAVTITLTQQAAPINGLLKAGRFVDVYLTPRIDSASDPRLRGGMTLTLFRGVRLLSITPGEPSDDPSSLATLELTPEQSAALILAREKGHLALSYNPEGKGNSGIALKNSDRATFDEILGIPATRAAPTTTGPTAVGPAPTVFTAEVYKGTARSTQRFEVNSKIEAVPAASTRIGMSANAPLWTRKSPAKSLPVPATDRFAAAPDGATVRQ